MDFDQVHLYRNEELNKIRAFLPLNAHVLEIGAGAGWQARQLSDWGYKVTAIDVQGGNYEGVRIYPVQNYDGEHLPFPNESFDVIFSSNTLEHVKNLAALNQEMKRVLTNTGICVHLVPSGSWSFWTSVTHYISSSRHVAKNIRKRLPGGSDQAIAQTPGESSANSSAPKKPPLGRYLRSLAIPRRHGERGTVWLEILLFSRWYWTRIFKQYGWIIAKRDKNGFFYTGYSVRGGQLSLPRRKRLASLLGSSCLIFVLKKK